MPDLPKKLEYRLDERAKKNALRELPVDQELIDFSSNDYLGFSRNEVIHTTASKLLSESGPIQNGATGSRLLSGNHRFYKTLEAKLSDFFEVESALVFNSGYDANVGFFSSVPQRGDIVFYDELIHASIRDGIKMGNAKSYKFKHNDLGDLKSKIELSVRAQSRTYDTDIYIVTESVFSMDGDSPNLRSLAEFCKKNKFHLIVDEAHAIGVFGKMGKGLVQELGLENQIFARIATFSKTLGCHGAAVLGSKNLTDYLINFARSLIYTTALPPHSIAFIISALEFLNSEESEECRTNLKRNIDFFKNRIEEIELSDKFLTSDSAIHCCLISGNDDVKFIAGRIQENGFDVKPIVSPTVSEDKERLRFCIHSFNTKEEIVEVLRLLTSFINKV